MVNHPLTILRGTVAALFSHSYGLPWGIAAVLPDDRDSRGRVSFSASASSWLMLSTRIGRADGVFMGRTVPSADPSTVWLAELIEAAEALAASAEPCDRAIVTAFGHRLEMPGLPFAQKCPTRGFPNTTMDFIGHVWTT